MHTKLPFVPALILVLAPSAVSLLLWVLAHFKRTSSKEREGSLERIPAIQHRRDDIRSILLVLGIATLAFTTIGAS